MTMALLELHRKPKPAIRAATGPMILWCRCRSKGHDVMAHLHRHDHLFQRGIAGACLPRPLMCIRSGARPHPPARVVGRGHAQIVVAMVAKMIGAGQ